MATENDIEKIKKIRELCDQINELTYTLSPSVTAKFETRSMRAMWNGDHEYICFLAEERKTL